MTINWKKLQREGVKIAETAGLKFVSNNLTKCVSDLGVDRMELKNMDSDALTIERPDGHFTIFLNGEDHRLRHRFSVAHEIAHLLLRPSLGGGVLHRRRFSPQQDTEGMRIERLCDEMASYILMPKDRIVSELNRLGWTAGSVSKLTDLFDVSFEVAGRRFINLLSGPCAMIFSKRDYSGGPVRQFRPSIGNTAMKSSRVELRYKSLSESPNLLSAFEVDDTVTSVETCVITKNNKRSPKGSDGRLVETKMQSIGRFQGRYRQIVSFAYIPVEFA